MRFTGWLTLLCVWLSPSWSAAQPLRLSDLGGSLAPVVAIGDHIYYLADDGTGEEVWVTDGTPAGTHLVRDIWKSGPQPRGGSAPPAYPSPRFLGVAGERLLFQADDG
ncbi:MAG: hypothetical protein ABI672_18330, partial [Vicinamibacteria bacterium]